MCGSDGEIYLNACTLMKHSCANAIDITMEPMESCMEEGKCVFGYVKAPQAPCVPCCCKADKKFNDNCNFLLLLASPLRLPRFCACELPLLGRKHIQQTLLLNFASNIGSGDDYSGDYGSGMDCNCKFGGECNYGDPDMTTDDEMMMCTCPSIYCEK